MDGPIGVRLYLELSCHRFVRSTRRSDDIEVLKLPLAVDLDVHRPLANATATGLRKMELHTVGPAGCQTSESVGSADPMKIARRLIDRLRECIRDATGVDRVAAAVHKRVTRRAVVTGISTPRNAPIAQDRRLVEELRQRVGPDRLVADPAAVATDRDPRTQRHNIRQRFVAVPIDAAAAKKRIAS